MSDTSTPDEDKALRRMLNTPPESHKPLKERRREKDEKGSAKSE